MVSNSDPIEVVIADDHPVVLLGIRALLGEQGRGVRVVGEAADTASLLHVLHDRRCDLLITDYAMPGANGVEDGQAFLGQVHRRYPQLPVIVLTMVRNPALVRGMLALGVTGVVDKAGMTGELMLAVNAATAGRGYVSQSLRRVASMARPQPIDHPAVLSRHEAEVVRLFASGLSVTQIAERLHRSVKTISQQKNDAMRKLGLASNSELYGYARSTGLVP